MTDLNRVINARSVAVVGASANPKSPGARVLRYLLRSYSGRVYAVNPRHQEVQGVKAYASVLDIPNQVDLAILVVPAPYVKDAVVQCAEKGMAGVLIFSAGFRETGEAGVALEEEIAQIARDSDMRVFGPNCAGFATIETGLYATFSATVEDEVLGGPVAVVSQSGGFGAVVFSLLQAQGIGVSHFITTGNELDVTVADAIYSIAADPKVEVVIAFSEGVKDAARFVAAMQAVRDNDKTIIVSHGGRSAAGALAVQSHTAATVTPSRVWAGVLAQYGATQCHDVEEMVDLAAMSMARKPIGGNCAVVTQTGGNGVLLVDELSGAGLSVPPLESEDKRRIEKLIPDFGSAANPIDVTGQMSYNIDLCRQALLAAAALDYIDVVICVLGPNDDIAESLVELLLEVHRTIEKPLIVTWMGGRLLRELTAAGVPAFPTPRRTALALSKWTPRQGVAASPALVAPDDGGGAPPQEVPKRPTDAQAANAITILEDEAKSLLGGIGFPIPKSRTANSLEEAVAAAEHLGYPLVLKLLDVEHLHRQEHGGVIIGLNDVNALKDAFGRIAARFKSDGPTKVLVEQMVTPGLELLIGMTRDENFGPVISIGMGGLLVEIVDEVQCRMVPFSLQQAEEAIDALFDGRLVGHSRGITVGQRSEVARMMIALGEFSQRTPEITDIDINPVIVNSSGAYVVDALMIRKAKTTSSSSNKG